VRSLSRSIRPRKRFGQHFLERAWIEKVAAVIAPGREDVFVEIGPGRGAITWPLLQQARHIIAFEVDRDLAAALKSPAHPNLTVVPGDFLEITADSFRGVVVDAGVAGVPVRLVGNLPYNVAAPILFKTVELVEAGLPIEESIFVLQREVADRILAVPGTPEYGVLAILLRHVAYAERLLALPPGAFRPAPKVHSSLIRLRWHAPAPAPQDLRVFRAVTRSVFTRRRKTLANALSAYALPPTASTSALVAEAGLDPHQRPETLDIPAFVRLADAVARARR
jgi:16S rRNA (adenine1518-N6/adenine1519-N6)-dimethyltransferase